MCSIFGVIRKENSGISHQQVRLVTERLLRLSESRGKDATGLALRQAPGIVVYKSSLAARQFIHTNKFKNLFREYIYPTKPTSSLTVMGHCRMATNGLKGLNCDNQPLIKEQSVAVHNGIIVNDQELWQKHNDCQRRFHVDTEIFLALLEKLSSQGLQIQKALAQIYAHIYGMTSMANMTNNDARLILTTNNGSLYTLFDDDLGLGVFASEEIFLKKLKGLPFVNTTAPIQQVPALCGMTVNMHDLTTTQFSLSLHQEQGPLSPASPLEQVLPINDISLHDETPPSLPGYVPERFPKAVAPSRLNIQRCTKCILPATIPFIEFDSNGVCNFCHNYQPKKIKGAGELEQEIAPFRKNNNRHDCVVAFSGGRDSSFGLHYIKKVLHLNPLAYSYDWGVITDLGRRNQSRLCGKLGVEHILIDAGIRHKLRNIRLNIGAWLRKPDLGTVPLLMAGDKPFYYYSGHLKKQHGLQLSIMCSGNPYERAKFKSGFSGVKGTQWGKGNLTGMPAKDKIQLALYYAKQFMINPAYINASLLDTLMGFYASYVYKDDNLYLYDYIPWDEEEINTTLREEYDWELAEDTKTTWRIGDGTAPFYNYIYYVMAGFSEFDTFRSMQIRNGALTRAKALSLIEEENQPRWPSMIWYAQRVGFDLEQAVNIINKAPKLYE